jgi:hypothetical protein
MKTLTEKNKLKINSRIWLLFMIWLSLSSCQPFGQNSIINLSDINILDPDQKTQVQINSGGTVRHISQSSGRDSMYTMDISLGEVYQQNYYSTNKGGKLELSLSGSRQ